MKAGLVSVTFRKLTQERIVELCAENSLGYIEWGGDIHVPAGYFEAAGSARKLCEEAGIVPLGYGSYYNSCDDFGKFDVQLSTAEILGAEYIRIWAGRSREYDSIAAENIKKCVNAAEAKGLKVTLECHRSTMTEDPELALRLSDETGCLLHFQPNPDITFEENLKALKLTKHRLSACHVFAWERGNIKLPLKAQEAQWREYAKVAGDVPYLLEFVKDDNPVMLKEDAETLRTIIGKS